jgi:hypothetical protein
MVTTTRNLLTNTWTADVDALEAAVKRFPVDQRLVNDCQVAFFEVAGDGQLHVNVTHRQETLGVRGWAGPAHMTDGFVHNRRFGDARPENVIRRIREMVFAEPSD